MSREAFGDPPEEQEPPQICPVCGGDWHTEGCEFGEEVSRRLKAERDAHKLAFENAGLRREVERLHGLLAVAGCVDMVQPPDIAVAEELCAKRGGYAHAQRWERGAVLDVNCKDGTQMNVRLPKKG